MKRPAWVPDLIDAHVYGGAVLVAAGCWMWLQPTGPLSLGLILLYLGLRRA